MARWLSGCLWKLVSSISTSWWPDGSRAASGCSFCALLSRCDRMVSRCLESFILSSSGSEWSYGSQFIFGVDTGITFNKNLSKHFLNRSVLPMLLFRSLYLSETSLRSKIRWDVVFTRCSLSFCFSQSHVPLPGPTIMWTRLVGTIKV